ncbi:MAG: glycosyltransferase family 9 protein [Desulfobacterales bacterium]|jgi:ADP-heptose:LPS heptosyltransferase
MQYKKICIIHLNQIGDLVFSLPLLKALKDNQPTAEIHSVVKPFLEELLTRSPWVDRVILRGNSIRAKLTLLKQIRRNSYDLLISLGRSEQSLLLASFSGAKLKAGYSHFFWDRALDLKEVIEGHNSWHNYAKLLRRLNVPFDKNDYVGLLHFKEGNNPPQLPKDFAVVSPAASRRRQMKAWDPAKFAELIILLRQNLNLSAVLVGSQQDRAYNAEIVASAKQKAGGNPMKIIDLTGHTGLARLCSIIKHASLFVGIDSGIMHLASSIDIPVVGLFGPSDPQYVGPQNQRSLVVRNDEMDCVPCYLEPCDHKNCMIQLGVDKVFDACRELLTVVGS